MRDGDQPPRGQRGEGKKLKALLDAGSGVQIEGYDLPDDPELFVAIKAWNLLSNGTGGIDYTGLPMVADMLGFDSIERLLHLLLVIKCHRPGGDEEE